jgi:hypothetical protein
MAEIHPNSWIKAIKEAYNPIAMNIKAQKIMD